SEIARFLIPGLVAFVVTYGVSTLLKNEEVLTGSSEGGSCQPNREVLIWVAVMFGTLALFALYKTVFGNKGLGGAMVCGATFVIAGSRLSGLSKNYAIDWNHEHIAGPVNYGIWPLPWPLGLKRAQFAISEIAELRRVPGEGFCLLDRQGRRIRRNKYYVGHRDLLAHLASVRPDLGIRA
ncbi:MAG: hypothetical protein AAFO58_12445, partial [Pseudomonadota bacterium]